MCPAGGWPAICFGNIFWTWEEATVPLEIQPKAFMPIKYLGKLLFPRLQPEQRWYQMKTVIAAVLIAVVFAGVLMGLVFWKNSTFK
jgi:hypothetical protein